MDGMMLLSLLVQSLTDPPSGVPLPQVHVLMSPGILPLAGGYSCSAIWLPVPVAL